MNETKQDRSRLLQPEQCMRHLGVSRSTFYALVRSEELTVVRIGTGPRKIIRVRAGDLEDYIETHTVPAAGPVRSRPDPEPPARPLSNQSACPPARRGQAPGPARPV